MGIRTADPTGEAVTFSAVATPISQREASLAAAADAFSQRPDLAPLTARTYRRTLERLELEFVGLEGWPSETELEAAASRLWGELAPASWNRNVAAVRSFLHWSRRHGHLADDLELRLDRRREHADRTRSIPYAMLERAWSRETIALREKALWRVLYETAARAGEILALDIEDLDLPNKRARIRSKGADLEWVYFQSGAARLLPRLIAGRRRGPVFLTDRAAPAATPSLDICPATGRARLSYRRAAAMFSEQNGGWTLHQLRHSAITHLAEAGESTVLIMAKSRHRSLRSLQRYARPGPDAVAALTARHDPGLRRR